MTWQIWGSGWLDSAPYQKLEMQLHKHQLNQEQQHQFQHPHLDQVADQSYTSSDLNANKRYIQEGNVQNSFTDVVGQVRLQNPTKTQSRWLQWQVIHHLHVTQLCFTQVKYPLETKGPSHHYRNYRKLAPTKYRQGRKEKEFSKWLSQHTTMTKHQQWWNQYISSST